MFLQILRFEIRFQLKRHLTYICAILFFVLAFGAVASDWVQIGGAIGSVNRNAPFVIMQIFLVMTLIGVFVTTAFVAGAVQRDYELDTASIFFAAPISKWGYLGGRFFGALVVAMVPFIAIAPGLWLGSVMPWVEAERVGAFSLGPYLFSIMTIVLPNVLLPAALFFGLATLTRSMLFTYVAVVVVFMGYGISNLFLADLENEMIAGIIDPFGFGAFNLATQYWTVAEKNTLVLALEGTFLWNRIVWLVLGAGIFGLTFLRFRFDHLVAGRKGRGRDQEEELGAVAVPSEHTIQPARQRFTTKTAWAQYAHESWREFLGMARGAPFIVLLLFAVLNLSSFALVMDQLYGTVLHPVTYLMVDGIEQGFVLFVFIVITFYSGDLIWKERALQFSQVRDALPTPTWIAWGSKLTALVASVIVLLGFATLTGMAMQVFSGYFNLEPAVYAKGVFGNLGVDFILLAVLAFSLQVATNNKYFGYLAMVLYFISLIVLPALDFEHTLYQFAARPDTPYSDMNKYGHFVWPTVWFFAYWGLVSVVLLGLAHLFWIRGTDTSARSRLAVAKQRLSPRAVSTLTAGFAGFVAAGAFIFYNTNVLNAYETSDDATMRQAEYEKKYREYDGLPQPRITGVEADVAIYPRERRATIDGSYVLRNKEDVPVTTLHVRLDPDVNTFSFGIPSATLESEDGEMGYYIYDLAPPLAPGDSMVMTYQVEIQPKGFTNSGSNTSLVYNGTFFNNFGYFPHFGYSRGIEITDPNERRKYDLPPAERMPPLSDDPADRRDTYISSDADWVQFATTVSTDADQIVIAPGYLTREWQEGGRRYFRYEMDAPILNFFSYLSADYTIRRDSWNDVAIEIFYHPGHEYNLDRMIESVKKSLAYYTENFGPYQHRQARIIEFPRYANFAQAFPNTIPYSEGLGFIARINDEEDIDYVFYVTAHEIGHQWWAHQVIGAAMQGATLMSETMAQYSALMVMEKEYGQEKMRRFLRYELDQYLQGRSTELLEELPLMYVENQGYVHYRKGSLVMYALRDYIGEEQLNDALARYVADVKFQEAPYTNSSEFVGYLRDATPDSLQYLIEDMFETITLYENRTVDATYGDNGDGSYTVTLNLNARKVRADGAGVETEITMSDWIDVGVFGETDDGEETILYLEKHRLDGGDRQLHIVVDGLPVRAGIDPYNKLIDRNPSDNVRRVGASS